MTRYVWTARAWNDDGHEAGEDLGIFSSKRKAMTAARNHANRSRLKWVALGHDDPSYFRAEVREEFVDDFGETQKDEVWYYVQRRIVQ